MVEDTPRQTAQESLVAALRARNARLVAQNTTLAVNLNRMRRELETWVPVADWAARTDPASLKQEIAVKTGEIAKLTEMLESQRAAHEAELEAQAAAHTAETEALRARVEALEAGRQADGAELVAFRERVAELEALRDAQSHAAQSLRAHIERVEADYDALKHSSSWRITGPVRVLGRRLRGLPPPSRTTDREEQP